MRITMKSSIPFPNSLQLFISTNLFAISRKTLIRVNKIRLDCKTFVKAGKAPCIHYENSFNDICYQ